MEVFSEKPEDRFIEYERSKSKREYSYLKSERSHLNSEYSHSNEKGEPICGLLCDVLATTI